MNESSTKDNDDSAELMGGFSNCCNGKVGLDALTAAKTDDAIRSLILPAGMRILSEPGQVAALGNSSNCCNGKVGADPTI